MKLEDAGKWLDVCKVERDTVGVLYIDGKFTSVLEPGLYAFWKDAAEAKVVSQDMREMQIDVSAQEFMTLDKVTMRMNASVTYIVKDAKLAVSAAVDVRQSLYRDVQFGLREVIGQQELDSFLTAKDEVTQGLKKYVVDKAAVLGLEVRSVGIKDVIMPGEIKDSQERGAPNHLCTDWPSSCSRLAISGSGKPERTPMERHLRQPTAHIVIGSTARTPQSKST
ncbi:MAG: slipin family protein, partial [Pirellula sp.]